MAANREKHEREQDLNLIAPLYLKGFSFREIASIVSNQIAPRTISHQTVAADVKVLLKAWEKSRVDFIDYAKVQELEKINLLEREYWQGWEKSKTDFKKKKIKRKGGAAKVDVVELMESDERHLGNPQFLQGVERCIERRCKLLGLDAPNKLEHSGALTVMDLLKAAAESKTKDEPGT